MVIGVTKMTIESKEELQKILNDFWLLDQYDYENLISMISQEIYEINNILATRPDDRDEQESLGNLILLREKLEYIISKGLYKK